MANGFRNTAMITAMMLAAGCASSPEVTSVGNGHWMITGHSTGAYNAGADTLVVANAAKAWCAKQSKQMVVRDIVDVSVTFSCELPPQKS